MAKLGAEWRNRCRRASCPAMPTRLTSIADLNLYVECRCWHNPLVPISELPEEWHDLTVRQAVDRLRCSRCRQRGAIGDWRIVHVGGSEVALEGMRRD